VPSNPRNYNDVAYIVARFAELGLVFSVTRHVDGTRTLSRFKHLNAYENEIGIKNLWSICLPDAEDKEQVIADYIEKSAAKN
jgi:hypothetical protein